VGGNNLRHKSRLNEVYNQQGVRCEIVFQQVGMLRS
jgi:hypothetical protein